MKKKIRVFLWLLMCCFLCVPSLSVKADTIYDSPYVSFAPNGEGFTIQPWDTDYTHYEEGTTISTGITSSVRALEVGEHYYYDWERAGDVPIGKWVVEHKFSQCIHDVHRSDDYYLGLEYGRSNCFKYYNSGWIPYCADCGEILQYTYFYMNEDAVKTIDYMACGMGYDYYHLCPYCSNLEQGVYVGAHNCKAISWNKYKVVYDDNRASLPYPCYGYMNPSFHMYNNATVYEGEPVVASTKLTKNAYSCIGYEFVGWNTEPDGSGTSYADKADILNLTAYDINAEGESLATITLYAQWQKSESTLNIDAGGGKYDGKLGITSITQNYLTQYVVDDSKVTPPKGYKVTFEENGGKAVSDVTSTLHFKEWSRIQPFNGTLINHIYTFLAPSGNIDTIRANYTPDYITLPETTKANATFGGWYYDEYFTQPAGAPGDVITPTKDMTLYAQWVELWLKSKDNYTDNDRKGAVDLRWGWTTPITNQQAYKLYQSTDNKTWKQVNTAADVGSTLSVSETFDYCGYAKTYTVPHSGLYTLTAYGAQGGNYGDKSGGKGGSVSGTFWLTKGDTLTYSVGGQNSYGGGGSMTDGGFSNGGGYTIISSQKLGATLLIAGGGGGATSQQDGGAGGSSASVTGSGNTGGATGASGMAGGGGGYQSGTAGTYTAGGTTTAYTEVTGETIALKIQDRDWSGMPFLTKAEYPSEIMTGMVDEDGNQLIGTKLLCVEGSDIYVTGDGESHSPTPYMVHEDPYKGCIVDGGDVLYLYWKNCGEHGSSSVRNRDAYHMHWYDEDCNGIRRFYRKTETPLPMINTSAYGGSNYVNTAYAVSYTDKAGERQGDGAIVIRTLDIGYLDDRELDAVAAPDLAAPEKVKKDAIEPMANSNGNMVQVSWTDAEDKGTLYYHQVHSHLALTGGKMCTSNIVQNTLTTGLFGYYYLVNTDATTAVNASNGSFVGKTKTWTNVTLSSHTQYLHVAPADVAGNVGQTSHIEIPPKKLMEAPWPIYTRQLFITSGDNVFYSSGEGVYYVRCDDATPFVMDFESYIGGNVTVGYQINQTIYESQMDGFDTAWNMVETPMMAISGGSITTNASGLTLGTVGVPVLKPHMNTRTIRNNANSDIWVTSEFLLGNEAHGKHIRVTPRAGVISNSYNNYSDPAADLLNGITLIGDCVAPEITGADVLNTLQLIDRSQINVTLELSAQDDYSGVKEFQVDIFNKDNVISKTYTSEADGCIRINITALEPIFSGDFTVTVTAVDNVGNVNTKVYEITEFGLDTKVERILAPHDSIFKCGESGILTITTWGYVEKLEIEFPQELVALDSTLNQTICYDIPTHTKTENIQFMIPLYTPYLDDYVITVRAYRGDKHLEDYPKMDVVGVRGTVLDELRTRLR
ncbi:MAG: InlB B-repeat-containing protein [Lachnospiraceae bacterium]|nr:InlB B-repeat-containing protein [Lachnospiraceae bacterium]